MIQEVLILVKPDGMRKALSGEIISHFLAGGLQLKGIKLVQVSRKLATAHYFHLQKKHFFAEIVAYLTGQLHDGSPVMAMVWAGQDAVKKCRAIAGATNPEEADPTSIRGKFGRITTKGVYENLVHVSSDKKEADREIRLWFKKSELLKGKI